MSVRDWVNSNSAAITVAAVAVILIALAVVVRNGMGGSDDPEAAAEDMLVFFADPTDKKIFVAPNRLPPMKNAEGREAYRVKVFSCGNCEKGERFIGYYERFPEEVKSRVEKMPSDDPEREELMQVSADGQRWEPAVDGIPRIVQALRAKCGKPALPCVPQEDETADVPE